MFRGSDELTVPPERRKYLTVIRRTAALRHRRNLLNTFDSLIKAIESIESVVEAHLYVGIVFEFGVAPEEKLDL